LRRLLRFSGPGFLDFLYALEELGERGHVALPGLQMPQLALERLDRSSFRVVVRWSLPGMGPIVMGCLRAMADDYGALALLQLDGIAPDGTEAVHVQLLDTAHSQGRSFDLGRVPA
jgi:hypothetical protein